jgi:hypothetical protein
LRDSKENRFRRGGFRIAAFGRIFLALDQLPVGVFKFDAVNSLAQFKAGITHFGYDH